MNIAAAVESALTTHPGVRAVRLAGSRAEGGAIEASDWDFLVETGDFAGVAKDLPHLVECLHPLARQWDRLSECECYMLMLHGPVKVDLIFAGVPHAPEDPWYIAPDTLAAVDAHFWDWILWLSSKQKRGRAELVEAELQKMWDHLLRPLGVAHRPGTLGDATAAYLAARDQWEEHFRMSLSRDLEREILPRINSAAFAPQAGSGTSGPATCQCM